MIHRAVHRWVREGISERHGGKIFPWRYHAKQIQRATSVPEKGMTAAVKPLEGQVPVGASSDVGDISWIAPTLHVTVATSPQGAPWHAWPVVATAGMSIGHKGMIRAAKTLAATMVDLYEQPESLAAMQAEFKAKKGDVVYKAYLPEGPPPLPENRRHRSAVFYPPCNG